MKSIFKHFISADSSCSVVNSAVRGSATIVYNVTSFVLFSPKDNKGSGIPSRFETDTYLIPAQPLRDGEKPQKHVDTNAHVIVHFGLSVS